MLQCPLRLSTFRLPPRRSEQRTDKTLLGLRSSFHNTMWECSKCRLTSKKNLKTRRPANSSTYGRFISKSSQSLDDVFIQLYFFQLFKPQCDNVVTKIWGRSWPLSNIICFRPLLNLSCLVIRVRLCHVLSSPVIRIMSTTANRNRLWERKWQKKEES